MNDQVSSLLNLDLLTVMVGKDSNDPEIIQQVKYGETEILFLSPECYQHRLVGDFLTMKDLAKDLLESALRKRTA